jgi:hypothetical protein
MVIKYPKSTKNIQNGYKIYKHFPIYGPPKFTQIGIFGFENKPSGNPGVLNGKQKPRVKVEAGNHFVLMIGPRFTKAWVS